MVGTINNIYLFYVGIYTIIMNHYIILFITNFYLF